MPCESWLPTTNRGCRVIFARSCPLWVTKWWGLLATVATSSRNAGALNPDLVITDVKMPEMDGIDAAGEIYRTSAIPVILISAHHEMDLIERAEADHAMAYLVKPVKQGAPRAGDRHRHASLRRVPGPAQRYRGILRQALADRKIIEQAKGILMSSTNMDEQAAFRRLQKLASEKNRKLIDIAHMILTAKEALRPADKR